MQHLRGAEVAGSREGKCAGRLASGWRQMARPCRERLGYRCARRLSEALRRKPQGRGAASMGSLR
jgi:hypothetical protein